ncbi:MAG: dihydrolipoyl dehydrogenase [Muribaculaceae bacterium]|nr:dihydrolipoyl dehydrogenase [Muribaculaceae bacterium]
MNNFDIIVVGSGPGGYSTAATAASMGLSVAIIERGELGGTCLNRGCIPTKALCRCAEVALTVKNASEFGVKTDNCVIDYPAMVERKDRIVDQLRQGVKQLLGNVTIVSGEARFEDAGVISVDGDLYTAPRIIIATGSAPAVLPVPGAELAVNSDYMLSAPALAPSLAIIGGGVIGMEFASIYSALGVDVTVIEYCKEILPPFDSDIAKRLRMTMKRRGVKFITSAQITSLSKNDDGINIHYMTKGKEGAHTAAVVLMAVGRKPVLPDGLPRLGIKLRRNAIEVDENMQTSIPGLYAIGDVNGLCMLAHAAEVQGRVALGIEKMPDIIPSAVFTVPECAMAGITEQQCIDRAIPYATAQSTFHANGKALAMGETDGMVKVIVNSETKAIIGVHICGAHAADLIQEAVMAMAAGFTAAQAGEAVHGHPTLSEALLSAYRRF